MADCHNIEDFRALARRRLPFPVFHYIDGAADDEITKDRNTVHGEVDCTYLMFEAGGETYLQLDTYGSSARSIPGKVSQSLQLNETGAKELRQLLRQVFGL